MLQRIAVVVALVVVLSVPFLVRTLATGPEGARRGVAPEAKRLVIVTPNVEQIREEFAIGFDRWHARVHGSRVHVDYRAPGGTSEIMMQLEAAYAAAARKGAQGGLREDGTFAPGTAPYDVFFGGGSFEHTKLREPRSASVGGTQVTYRIVQPAGFSKGQLEEWYGENRIGAQELYDAQGYWFGAALSGFGIVYNRDVLKELHLPEPRGFVDLTDSRYFNMLALTDARLSGSVTTAYDSILNKEGWERGWRMLREMAGNARYFASAAPRAAIDVAQGEAAAGLAIDFYGRTQGQYLLKPGQRPEEGRVGYVDPEGSTYIDADPVAILNGARDADLARRFVEFCLSEEGQALWQFPATGNPRAASNPVGPDGLPMGPERYELRRMPVRRVMYERYAGAMVDRIDPFGAATDVKVRGWRGAIGPLMAAFGIETAPDCRRAWRALNLARAAAQDGRFSPEVLAEMERLFYAMPTHTMRDGTRLELNEANFAAIKGDTNSWRDPLHGREALIGYTTFTRENYERVVEMEEVGRR